METIYSQKTFNKICGIFYIICLMLVCLPIMISFTSISNFSEINFEILYKAIIVSVKSSFISMIIVFILGIPTSYFIAKSSNRYIKLTEILFNIPLILPPAVTGIILLLTFGNNGVIGKSLLKLGIDLSFNINGVILVLIFVALPIFINGVITAFREVDINLENTAKILGDNDFKVFLKISLPIAKNQIITSFIFSFARSIGEFGATTMFAGNIIGVTQTMPLAIYNALESNIDTSIFMSLIMILLSIIILVSAKFMARRI